MSDVDTTNPILQPIDTVDTDPKLKPLRTLTLDEDPAPVPSATLLLDPVAPKHDLGLSAAVTVPKKRKAPLENDAFESAPSLAPAKSELPRGSASPWKKTEVWTPGLIALTVALVFMVLVTIVVFLRS